MQLHNNSGNITVIIDVSFDDRDMFTDFILNEQCQFIDSVDPEGLIKFEWFLDEVIHPEPSTRIDDFTIGPPGDQDEA